MLLLMKRKSDMEFLFLLRKKLVNAGDIDVGCWFNFFGEIENEVSRDVVLLGNPKWNV